MAHEVKANGAFTDFLLKAKKILQRVRSWGIYHRNDFHITRYLDLEGGWDWEEKKIQPSNRH